MTETDLTMVEADRDGALVDALSAVDNGDGLTRSQAFRTAVAGFGGAALLGGLGATTARAATISKKNDLKILAFALVAEELGAAFYYEALQNKKLTGETRQYAQTALKDERAHILAVSKQIRSLGGRPAKSPKFDFRDTVSNQVKFRKTAAMIEELCVETLNGAGPLVTKSTLMAAGRLVTVEARQVTWIRLIIGNASTNPVPSAFDSKVTLAQAAAKVKKTHFVKA